MILAIWQWFPVSLQGIMIKVFFITVMVITSRVPSQGWLQWTQSYSDRTVCEDIIREDYDLIELAIKRHMGQYFREVREMRCLTYSEAVRINTELGH